VKKILPSVGLLLYCIFCLMLVPAQASAYIDPSTTTFLVSSIIGVAVALIAGFSIHWRKAKKKVKNMVGKEDVTNDESDKLEDL